MFGQIRNVIRLVLKKTTSIFFKKWYNKYSAKTHTSIIENLTIETFPGVFNPSFLLSTKTLIRFLKTITLFNKRFLELGCGTGAISVWAAHQGAIVTGTDINPKALENARRNAELNNVIIKTKATSLIKNIDLTEFDLVVINPPYYPNSPKNLEEQAWFCGEKFEYFSELFSQLERQKFRCDMYMILSEDCAIESIKSIAHNYSLVCNLTYHSKNIIEHEFIYKIENENA